MQNASGCPALSCRYFLAASIAFLSILTVSTHSSADVISEKQARRALQVTILNRQFDQADAFGSDQLSAFYTWMQLSNEVDRDIRAGITRPADYYRKRALTIDDYFHQQVLSRPTLLSHKDKALIVWKTSLLFSAVKVGSGLAAGITDAPMIALIADAAQSTIATAASIYEHEFNPDKALRNKDLVLALQGQARQKMNSIFYAGFGKCDQAPSSCQAFDDTLQEIGRPAGLDPVIPYNILASQHAFIPLTLRTGSDNLLHFDPQSVASGATSQLLRLAQDAIEPDVAELKRESDLQLANGFIPTVRGPNPSPETLQQDTERQQIRAAQFDLALKTVDFSTQLLGLVNPKLANQIRAVEQATVFTAKTISGYLTQVRHFKSLGKTAGTLDTLALASSSIDLVSGLVGVGVQLFSMFADSGPSADQVILEQIRKLTELVETVRIEMHERFDRIDLVLNEVLITLHDNFERIDYTQRRIIGNVTEIRRELVTVQVKLNEVEQYLSRWLQDTQKDDFVRAVNGCLNYKAKFGLDLPRSEFVQCATFFYTWATSTALRDLWSGTTRSDFSDDGIKDNVENFPLSATINWMFRFPAGSLGTAALWPHALPNPIEWTLAAQAYLQLMREWPQWAETVSRAQLDTIGQLGQSLVDAIGRGPIAGGTTSVPSPLFDALIRKYLGDITALQRATDVVEQNYINDPSSGVIDQAGRLRLDIWAPVSAQRTTNGWRPTLLTCGTRNIALSDPLSHRIPELFAVAHVLELGELTACLTEANWVQERVTGGLIPNVGGCLALPIGNPVRFRYARFKTTLEVRSRNITLWRLEHLSNEQLIERVSFDACLFPNLYVSADQFFAQNWTSLIAPALTNTPFSPLSAEEQSARTEHDIQVTTNLERILRDHQRAVYGRTATELSASGAVRAASDRLEGMKALLSSYASLLLPETMEQNEYVRSIFRGDGDQAIVGHADVLETYLSAQSAPLPDLSTKIDFSATAVERAVALHEVLSEILTALVQEQRTQRFDLVADTLDDIELLLTANTQPPAAPPTTSSSEPLALNSISTDIDSPQRPGTAVTFVAGASGGIAPYQYKWWVFDGSWNVARDWNVSNTFTWAPSTPSTGYRVAVWVRNSGSSADVYANSNSNGSVGYSILPSTVPMSIASMTASASSPAPAGSVITFTAAGTGGTAPYQYKWRVSLDGGASFATRQDWGASNTFTWTPATAVPNAQIVVWTRSDGFMSDAPETEATLPFVITTTPATGGGPLMITAVTPDVASPQTPGTTVTFSATASGGSPPYQYKWWVFDGVWNVVRDWAPTSTFVWTPSAPSPAYRIGVWVRNAGSTADAYANANSNVSIPYPIVSASTPISLATLTSNVASPQPAGAAISFTAIAAGGTGSYQYKWLMSLDGGVSFTTRQDWGPGGTFTWTPTGETANAQVTVWTRSSGTTADAPQAKATLPFVITTPAPIVGPLVLNAVTSDVSAPQAPGTTITFSATASGGSPPYHYKWWVFDGGWYVVRDWTPNGSLSWTPTAPSAGYRVAVWVRNAGSTVDAYANANSNGSVSYPILNASIPISVTNLTSNLASPQAAGTAMIFTATAVGGSAPYQYKWRISLDGGTSYATAQDWSSSSSFTWLPTTAAANAAITVWVRRSNVATDIPEAQATLPFVVTSSTETSGPLALSAIVPNVPTSQVGNPALFTAVASGGTAPYQYKWWLYSEGTWTPMREWTSDNTFIWTPATPSASYRIGVWIRNAGNTADASANANANGSIGVVVVP
jgi:hypothetical protein